MLTPRAWHNRFQQQAQWTQPLRLYLLERLRLRSARRMLEVGCGTGAVLSDLMAQTGARLYGIDLDLPRLLLAREVAPQAGLAAADGLRLPYATGAFDAVLCHFYLLWVADAPRALAEMARVTQPGGWVAALAEPDYGGRIDHPAPLAAIGEMQGRALARQGADGMMGRKLAGLFTRAGLKHVQTGVLGGEWGAPPAPEAWESEWAVLEEDLRGQIAPGELAELRQQDAAAWKNGERILYVPTFYAVGRVGEED
jgi:SAM-dependent methyltransferase